MSEGMPKPSNQLEKETITRERMLELIVARLGSIDSKQKQISSYVKVGDVERLSDKDFDSFFAKLDDISKKLGELEELAAQRPPQVPELE